MKGKRRRKAPEIVLREGKPSAVILDIDEERWDRLFEESQPQLSEMANQVRKEIKEGKAVDICSGNI